MTSAAEPGVWVLAIHLVGRFEVERFEDAERGGAGEGAKAPLKPGVSYET